MSDITLDLCTNSIKLHKNHCEPWRVTLVDTGELTMTGGRLKRVQPYLEDEEAFCLTYGDGVANVNIAELIAFHKAQGKLATVTAVAPPGRFGALVIHDKEVRSFQEKPQGDGRYINGGFFVLSPRVFSYITEGDATIWERTPLEKLAADGQLSAFTHDGFWHPVDTLRDKMYLEQLWKANSAPWNIWDQKA